MKKNKLINLIFFFNEDDLLQKRIEYYRDYVDEFFIFDLKSNNLKYEDSILSSQFLNLIKQIGNLNFEDTIWCSKVGDIILPQDLHNLNTNSDFKIFNHKILNWSDNLSVNSDVTGSFSFSYSSFLRNKKLQEEIYHHLQTLDNIRNHDNVGFQLIGFQDPHGLIENLNFYYGLEYNTSEINFIKQNLICLDEYNRPEVLKDINSQLGGFFNIPFEPRPPKEFEIEILPDGLMIDNIYYNLEIPKNYPLGDKNDFIKNESLGVIKQHFPLSDDSIVLKNKTENKVSVLKYSDFINCIPSKLT
jgi:hypothetical protein